jgi:hypothetical protein
MLFVVIGTSNCILIHVIKLNIKIKMIKSVKFQVISGVVSYKSGLIYKILRRIDTFCIVYFYLIVVWVVLTATLMD